MKEGNRLVFLIRRDEQELRYLQGGQPSDRGCRRVRLRNFLPNPYLIRTSKHAVDTHAQVAFTAPLSGLAT